MILHYVFPQGKKKVLTFSYDDGPIHDKRLVSIFNEYGMKGTFHLNSAFTENDGKVHRDEFGTVYAGHEISCHGKTHPFEDQIPLQSVIEDVRDDRIALEAAAGYPVYGMSYPFGTFSEPVKNALRALGIVYCRTVKATRSFHYFPDDFLEWHPTAHHRENIAEIGEAFLKNPYGLKLLYIWGHSYEFNNANNWNVIEAFCKQMSGKEDIWYATNMEIYEYMQASKRLIISMNGEMIRNPSAMPVWIAGPKGVAEIPGGATVVLG